MGVRFACHGCGKHLNIKRDLAGKRGVCPACQIRFRIPNEDAEKSFPVETNQANDSESSIGMGPQSSVAVDGSSPTPFTTRAAGSSSEQPPAHSSSDALAYADAPDSQGAPSSPGPTGVAVGSPVSLAMIDSEDAATWYVRPPTGGQYGPADTKMLRQWIDQGRVASNSLLWRDGWPQWRSAVEALPEFAETLAAADAPPQTDVQKNASAQSDSGKNKTSALSGDSKIGTKRSHTQAKRYGLIGGLAAMTIGLCAILAYLLWR